MPNTPLKLTVRLVTTNEMMENWRAGKATPLDQQALQQAEQAAKVRYFGKQVKVAAAGTEEWWLVEGGKVSLGLDFSFEVTVS